MSDRPIFLTERDLSRVDVLQMAESAEALTETCERAWAKAMEDYQKQALSFRERIAAHKREAASIRNFLATMNGEDLAWVEVVNRSYRFRKLGPGDVRKESTEA